MKREIKVQNCHECPFAKWWDPVGYDGCVINNEIELPNFEQLPSDKVHDLCPLKKGSITVKLNNDH